MDNAFSRLAKVLSLERKQGYRNKAVIGGLDKFASRWETDARAEATDQSKVNEIVALLIGYPSVTEQNARERIIDLLMRRLKEVNQPAGADDEPAPAGPGRSITEPPVPGSKERPVLSARTGPPPPAPVVSAERADDERGPEDASVIPSGPSRRISADAERTEAADHSAQVGSKSESAAAEPAARAERPSARAMPARSKPEIATPVAAQPAAPAPPVQARSETAQEAPQQAAPQHAIPPQAVPQQAERVTPNRRDLPPSPEDDFAADLEEDEEDVEEGLEPEPSSSRSPSRARNGGIASRNRSEEREMASVVPSGRGLDAPVTRLPSIGPSYAEKLVRLGVRTVRDLLFLLPHHYDDYSVLRTIDRLNYGEEVTVIGTVWDLKSRIIGEGRRLVSVVVGDGTGEMQMNWYNPFVERQLRVGRPYVFSGKIDSYRGKYVMSNPEFEPLEREMIHTARLVPVYPLTQGVTNRWLRRVIKHAVDTWAESITDFLPENMREDFGLLSRAVAISQIHFPDGQETLAAAHRRLSFDEFLVLQLGVLGQRQQFRDSPARPLRADESVLAPFLAALPFKMTGAQSRTLAEIARDLAERKPMSRLLQGDVGSGKTAVAAAALWAAVADGSQAAIMAPTEILAEQHARSFQRLFAGLSHPVFGRPIQVTLLTGRKKQAEREEILTGLAAGDIDIAVGTQALIQEEVSFRNLSLAIVDEQHRFGVEQRAALRQKGTQPHLLVMSATPIPRSLALTVYGDLDVSAIDEMPAGRTPVRTKWMASSQRERAYDFIRRQVKSQRQAFIIYPMVENSEHSEMKAAVDEHRRLQSSVFPELRLGLLHGRLKSEEKDDVMRSFATGEIDILVATSVVEVGIDVPNATVILIDGAERFGLAQLHQFRGRVGRGEYPSYCILISDAAEGDSARRLQALETSNDGFALAQTDLEMRGPGDFFGTRQSGLPVLRMARLSDLHTLEEARAAGQKVFADDPQLNRPEHKALATEVAAFWRGTTEEFS